jgi:hypothetical protein
MNVTKDVWICLSKAEKKAKMVEALTQLHNIDSGRHALSHKFEQGRLPRLKKDLEAFIIEASRWESDRQLTEHKTARK